MKFENRVALITGASKSIGLSIARKLNEEGAITIITSRRELEDRKQFENFRFVGNLYVYKLDLLERQAIVSFVGEILQSFGKVDFLINNASYSDERIFGKNFFEYDIGDMTKPFEVDVVGAVLLAQGFVKKMMEQNFGRIIFFSSASALKSDEYALPYAMAKSAIVGTVKSLAKSFACYGITVNAIAPGAIGSEHPDMPSWIERWNVSKEWVEKTVQSTPVKRLGHPEDISDFVLYLLSQEAGYITGQIINIDGGAYL